MKCPICFTDTNEFKKVWNCDHGTCELCSNKLITCPFCRSNKKVENRQPTPNCLDINKMKHIRRVDSNYNQIYLNQWGKKECISNNHNMILVQPYGVTCICETCNLILCFNVQH